MSDLRMTIARVAPALVLCSVIGLAPAGQRSNPYSFRIQAPRLVAEPVIDGDLSEWRDRAYSDGVWDIARLAQTPWYDPARNRLTIHGAEPSADQDLSARYFIAWDETYLYLGAEARDNRNDVDDPEHEPKRWYYKDAVCWFVEAPRLEFAKQFGEADNAFCFVIDESRPPYAAWWRHGTPEASYVEEPLQRSQAEYALVMNPWGGGEADFVLEARIDMKSTLGVSSPQWSAPEIGDIYGLQIVHTDPDGGGYGGHFIVYGAGDDDSTWGVMELVGPKEPIERKSQ
jgi:hypothetical protein